MIRLACLLTAALVATALAIETTATLNLFNYDTALAINRLLGLYTAVTLHMSLITVIAASLFWYGVPIGILWFCPACKSWRVGRLAWLHEERTRLHVPAVIKGAVLAVVFGLAIWQLALWPLLTLGVFVVITFLLARYKQPLMKWTDSKPRWVQVGAMMVVAWAPAGIFPCMLVIERWQMKWWGWQALVNAVIQALPVVVLWLLAGHIAKHQSISQHIALDSCRVLCVLLPVACLGRWLLVRHRRKKLAASLVVPQPRPAT